MPISFNIQKISNKLNSQKKISQKQFRLLKVMLTFIIRVWHIKLPKNKCFFHSQTARQSKFNTSLIKCGEWSTIGVSATLIANWQLFFIDPSLSIKLLGLNFTLIIIANHWNHKLRDLIQMSGNCIAPSIRYVPVVEFSILSHQWRVTQTKPILLQTN